MPEIDPRQWAAADVPARFALAVDSRDAELTAGLFAPDAVLRPPGGTVAQGRAAILAHYQRAMLSVGATRHVLSNGVRVGEADGAERSWWYTLIVAEERPGSGTHRLMSGCYELVVRDGQIAELALTLDGTWGLTP